MVTADRRNPYVILGVDFGASEAAARGGFGRAMRRLRQEPDAPYTAEDLTWALHQVEQILTDPGRAFHVYRIPADSRALSSDANGEFDPTPHQLERHTQPATVEELDRLRKLAIAQRLAAEIAGTSPHDVPKPPYTLKEE